MSERDAVPTILDTGFDGELALRWEHLPCFLTSVFDQRAVIRKEDIVRSGATVIDSESSNRGSFLWLRLKFAFFHPAVQISSPPLEARASVDPFLAQVFIWPDEVPSLEATLQTSKDIILRYPNLEELRKREETRKKRERESRDKKDFWKIDSRPLIPLLGTRGMEKAGLSLTISPRVGTFVVQCD